MNDYIGMSVDDAVALAKSRGYTLRIVTINGVGQWFKCDSQKRRINIEISQSPTDGKQVVTGISGEW
jgi:beta-lactam-binding protein with PASTA domain